MEFEITKVNGNEYYTIRDNESSIGNMDTSNTVDLDGYMVDFEDLESVEKVISILIKALVTANTNK